MALVAAPAAGQDYSSCAGIQNPFAYNACLATHGPQAHETLPGVAPANPDKPWAQRQATTAHATTAPRVGGGMRFSRGRNGRMSVQFTLSDPSPTSRHRRAIQ